MGLITARNQRTPRNMDLRGPHKDEFIEKYKEISSHPFANEIRTLFEFGFSNLSTNVEAIDRY
jgi:hypothetical protein